MCPFGLILGYIICRLVINNQVLNKTKIAVAVEISSREEHKYEVNMMKV